MEFDVATGLIWFLAFLFSTTVHEAMHAFAAWRLGDPTAYQGGQVSLNPAPHIQREPIGMVVLPLLTSLTQGWAVGWASCPYDPIWARRYPGRSAVMAAAGPARQPPDRDGRVRGIAHRSCERVVRRARARHLRLHRRNGRAVVRRSSPRCCRCSW